MNPNFKKFFIVLAVLGVTLAWAHAAFAAPSFPYWGQGGLLSCNAETQACSLCDLLTTVQNFIYFALTILLFVLAPLMFAWGGITILLAGASSGKIDTGKKILISAVWGVVIGLAAYLIVNLFFTVFGVRILGGSGNTNLKWSTISCSELPAPFNGVPSLPNYTTTDFSGSCAPSAGKCGGCTQEQCAPPCNYDQVSGCSAPAVGTSNCNPACTGNQVCTAAGSNGGTPIYQCQNPPSYCDGKSCGGACKGPCGDPAAQCVPQNGSLGTTYQCITGGTQRSSWCEITNAEGFDATFCWPGDTCLNGGCGQCFHSSGVCVDPNTPPK